MSTATENIAAIDSKIAALLADTSMVGDYRIGDKQVDKGTFLKQLIETRKMYVGMVQDEPYESIDSVAYDIDEFGIDNSEYIGDFE
jgi:hypothetical protein